MKGAIDHLIIVEQESRSQEARVSGQPICVDLDGTLVHSDTLEEGVALSGLKHLALAFSKLFTKGRAGFKHEIAIRVKLDPGLLPYNHRLIDYLTSQKEKGRYLVLATAANRAVAEAVASHLKLFDEIIASDETHNLKGRTKANALAARFGEKRFVYAGNDASDLPVWAVSSAAIVVNAAPRIARQASKLGPVEATILGHPDAAFALLRAMRPRQWIKNLLVFVPILTAHAIREMVSWENASLLFLAFCATASAIYLVNDAVDLTADRRHPRKKFRPFASGALGLSTGLVVAGLMAVMGATLAIASGTLLVITAYAVMSVSYSLRLKELPLVDVFLLASLYTIRIYGGGVATGHDLSLWLLGFSGFLFLGLAFLKRVIELSAPGHNDKPLMTRRDYMSADIAILRTFGCASSFASCVVLALFVQLESTAQQYTSPGLLWGIVPVMLFWQCRLWLSASRNYMNDDPIVYSVHDWVSWVAAITLLLLLALARIVTI